MRLTDVQIIGEELALKWDDGGESFIRLKDLRRHCPCAGCKGEVDITGKIHRGPEQTLTDAAFQLQRIAWVGSYGLQPFWSDGHNTGIFSFDYLKRVGEMVG